MTEPLAITYAAPDAEALAQATGRIALLVETEGRMSPAARKVDQLTRKAVSRLVASPAWEKAKPGEATLLAFPAGLAAEGLVVVKAPRKPTATEARAIGAALAKARGTGPLTVVATGFTLPEELAMALTLRAYDFVDHKTAPRDPTGPVTMVVDDPDAVRARLGPFDAVASGVFFTRDLVNEPANVLTTTEFAQRLEGLRDLGVEVEVLEEADLERLGMRLLLAVGQGSESPSKVVVMQWNGGGDEKPFAFVGKGVVFDTGGISIKPAGGMEDMTMDMGGAGVVAGVMRTLALRKARANVVGLVGLVENMPSGNATRPGDVVASMKGDTVEIINTDAEGRLVLADVLWYAQDRFQPTGIVNLATLTGAIIVALGHENAGVFSNDDALADALVAAAKAEGEGAWRMPMGDAYDQKLKSRIADMMNVGGRDGGSITAAQFLKRFIKDGTPWCHIDIAGVASVKSDTTLAPKGATGWGVMALNRLIADRYEAKG
ncbi:leucyl aminopeptidase [Rubellimicrobium rubrum]|uniref:Probable cytosol aminopeptidase n=1 Tax=Rubellimicrobium rubrum TaxID=2585369 RepID=A0A5C4N6U1_9RHOB|nr:leucyl aminopeptidase [Rubellimicrobium rubrum]TNC52761.1 leucyl aminopeptidase [Rubellimicrobium rubrum]